MKTKKIIRVIEIIALAIIFFVSERIYSIFLLISWAVDALQKKRGYKDKGERKFDKEQLIMMVLLIPEGQPLTGPSVRSIP